MKEVSADEYESSGRLNILAAGEAKVGKTCSLVAQALGVFPGQKYGGIVDRPENLHVVAMDSGAANGINNFLTKSCGAPKEALKYRIWDCQQDVLDLHKNKGDWSHSFYNLMHTVKGKLADRASKGGHHAVIISSLSTMSQALKRALAGDPAGDGKRGTGMDMSKWARYGDHVGELRIAFQSGPWHLIWEGHVTVTTYGDAQDGEAKRKESLAVQGQAGSNFLQNVEQVVRIKRMFGEKIPGTPLDQVYFDTRPTFEFVANGRAFTESLAPKETDLTFMAHKLGLKIGRWGAKGKAA